jgi:hypothetical protein
MWADLINSLTVGKLGSSSATERLGWAQQGWDAFKLSSGLGVGVGSFRSSSLAMALIGSVGILGCTAFILQMARIAWPRIQTGVLEVDALTATAQWTSLLSLLPLFISGSTPDPALIFGVFAGVASAAPARRLLGSHSPLPADPLRGRIDYTMPSPRQGRAG